MSKNETLESTGLSAEPSILALAGRIETVYQEMERDEGLVVSQRPETDPRQAEAACSQDDLIETLQAQIETLTANDLGEALIHAMLASAQVEYLRSCLTGDEAVLLKRAERLIGSVIRVLSNEQALDLAGLGGRRFLVEQGETLS